jgi:hypothetical protein
MFFSELDDVRRCFFQQALFANIGCFVLFIKNSYYLDCPADLYQFRQILIFVFEIWLYLKRYFSSKAEHSFWLEAYTPNMHHEFYLHLKRKKLVFNTTTGRMIYYLHHAERVV